MIAPFVAGYLLFHVFSPLVGVFVGWRAGRRDGESSRIAARLLSLTLFAGFFVAVVTGWLRSNVYASSIHGSMGFVLFDLTLFAVSFAITLSFRQHFRQRPIATILQVAIFMFLLVVTFVVSLSGYLGPDHAARDGRVLAEATLNRFMVLHLYFLPVLIPLLHVEWWWFFGARKQHGAGGPEPGGIRETEF